MENLMDNKSEKKIYFFIYKYVDYIFLVLMGCLFFLFCVKSFYSEHGDMTLYLKPWYKILCKNHSLKEMYSIPNFNYTPIFSLMYYIESFIIGDGDKRAIFACKFPSMVCLMFTAIFSYLFVKKYYLKIKGGNNKSCLLVFFAILFNPSTLWNVCIWGQTDLIYVCFCIMALYFLYFINVPLAFLVLGIGFAFKMHAIFLLPVFICYAFEKRISLLNFSLFFIPYIISSIVVGLLGAPFEKAFFMFARPSHYFTAVSPNIGTLFGGVLFDNPNNAIYWYMIIMSFAIFLSIFYIFLKNKFSLNNLYFFVLFSFLSCVVAPYFLPGMHGRYFCLAETISIIFAFIAPKYLYVTVLVLFSSLPHYVWALTGNEVFPVKICSTIILLAIILLFRLVYKEKAKVQENEKK